MHETFDDASNHNARKVFLNYLDTQCIMITHASCMGILLIVCVIFLTVDVTHGGAFIQYIVISENVTFHMLSYTQTTSGS